MELEYLQIGTKALWEFNLLSLWSSETEELLDSFCLPFKLFQGMQFKANLLALKCRSFKGLPFSGKYAIF
jgi:hypothetical protein